MATKRNDRDRKRIPVAEPELGKEELKNATQAVRSGWISSKGEYIGAFEKAFARFIGTRYAVAMANGTVALHAALVALNIGKGDEVIVPDLTYIATANAVAYTGATPVFAGVDIKTWCIDGTSVESLITKRTKAIIPVHLYGHPADMRQIMQLAKRHNLFVVEDAAEAHGAEYRGKKVGSIGDMGVFSFFGNKIITTGEGGMVVTNNRKLYTKLAILKNQGMDPKRRYWHPTIGFNYRMTNIQAAIGLAQVAKAGQFIAKKKKIFEWYKKHLKGVGSISLNPETSMVKNVFWMICLVFDRPKEKDAVARALEKNGIETRPFFYPVTTFPMHKKASHAQGNRNAAWLSARGLNLPSSTKMREKDVRIICEVIRRALKR